MLGGGVGDARSDDVVVVMAVLLSEIHKVSVQYGMQSGKCLLRPTVPSGWHLRRPSSSPLPHLPTNLPFYPPTYLPTRPQYLVAVVYVILLFRIVPHEKHSQGCSSCRRRRQRTGLLRQRDCVINAFLKIEFPVYAI